MLEDTYLIYRFLFFRHEVGDISFFYLDMFRLTAAVFYEEQLIRHVSSTSDDASPISYFMAEENKHITKLRRQNEFV